jgi:xylulokinase
MTEMGLPVETVRAAHANLFRSRVFREAFATVTGTTVELIRTDGAEGAARGAGLGAEVFSAPAEAFEGLKRLRTVAPAPDRADAYEAAYRRWTDRLDHELARLDTDE